jgi:hypothetical protein
MGTVLFLVYQEDFLQALTADFIVLLKLDEGNLRLEGNLGVDV